MFSTIYRKELLDQLINPKFFIVLLLCLILVPPSLLMNYANYKDNLKEYEFLVNSNRENIRAIIMQFQALHGFRKPSILSTFANGFESSLPKIAEFSKYEIKTKGTEIEGEKLSSVVGKIDFVYIVGYLLGLFALLYASTLIVSEKEAGTLKLVLSNNTNRSTFIFGKSLAGYTVLIIPLISSFLIGLLLLIFSGSPLFSGENLGRIIALFIVSLLFISTFFSLGVFISTRTHKTSMALIAGFLTWVFITLIIPKISEPLANIVHPIPSDDTVEMNKTRVIYQLKREQARKLMVPHEEAMKSRDWKNYYKIAKPVQEEYNEKIGKAVHEIESKHKKESEFNTDLSLIFSRLSPFSDYMNSALNLCHTGLADREKFKRDIESYRIQLEDLFFKNASWDLYLRKNEKGEEEISGAGWGWGGVDVKTLPEFNYKFIQFEETLRKSLIDILLLIIYNLIFFVGSYFSFVRYDVR